MIEGCSCDVEFGLLDGVKTWRIVQCPMHARAEAMEKALEEILRLHALADAGFHDEEDFVVWQRSMNLVERKARAALGDVS